jgi:hypothetical protein
MFFTTPYLSSLVTYVTYCLVEAEVEEKEEAPATEETSL